MGWGWGGGLGVREGKVREVRRCTCLREQQCGLAHHHLDTPGTQQQELGHPHLHVGWGWLPVPTAAVQARPGQVLCHHAQVCHSAVPPTTVLEHAREPCPVHLTRLGGHHEQHLRWVHHVLLHTRAWYPLGDNPGTPCMAPVTATP